MKSSVLKYLWLAVCFLCLLQLHAQKLMIKAGYGNYNAFNAGMSLNTSGYTFETGAGTDFNITGQGNYSEIHFIVGKRVGKKQIHSNSALYFYGKGIAWKLESSDHKLSAASLASGLMLRTKLSSKFQIGFDAGIIWNYMLQYKLKNYDNAGYIREWQPDFGITLYRQLR
jgi:hypothetical protein